MEDWDSRVSDDVASRKGEACFWRTLFHAVFFRSLVIGILVHGCNSLNTFFVMVLVGGALG